MKVLAEYYLQHGDFPPGTSEEAKLNFRKLKDANGRYLWTPPKQTRPRCGYCKLVNTNTNQRCNGCGAPL